MSQRFMNLRVLFWYIVAYFLFQAKPIPIQITGSHHGMDILFQHWTETYVLRSWETWPNVSIAGTITDKLTIVGIFWLTSFKKLVMWKRSYWTVISIFIVHVNIFYWTVGKLSEFRRKDLRSIFYPKFLENFLQ